MFLNIEGVIAMLSFTLGAVVVGTLWCYDDGNSVKARWVVLGAMVLLLVTVLSLPWNLSNPVAFWAMVLLTAIASYGIIAAAIDLRIVRRSK